VSILPADPGGAYRAHQAEIDAAIEAVLTGNKYILGPQVESFEAEFAAFVTSDTAVGVGNGTDALAIALTAAGIGPGDVVATVSHTATATVAAIEMAGAVPVFIDIDAATYTMDPEHLEATVRDHAGPIKGVVPVHLYGQGADMTAIMSIAATHGLVVVEDCAQAHGATVEGRAVGTFGAAGSFSFYPTKNLAALGDGGAIVAGAEVGAKARLLREYGWKERFVSAMPGVNSRLDELQAAILRVKLRHLAGENERRRALAAQYDSFLVDAGVGLPVSGQGRDHVYHQYVITLDERDHLKQELAAASIITGIHYPVPVHQQPAYAGRVAVGAGGLPVTEMLRTRILSLPIHPLLSDEDVALVAHAITTRTKA
jgi:dTDP-4-amino-4,6-dideoxygalactose transaminase